MYTENANRAVTGDVITQDNARPNPKNPIIGSFFRNIWYADELGSGVRNLYRYSRLYSGQEPQLIDGDVFRIIMPLDDSYSFDALIGKDIKAQDKAQNKAQLKHGDDCALPDDCALITDAVTDFLRTHPKATQMEIAKGVGKSRRSIQNVMAALKEKGAVEHVGAKKNGRWLVKQPPSRD